MRPFRTITVLLVILGLLGGVLAAVASPQVVQRSSLDQVWQREDDYWRYVQAGDVQNYLALWNAQFVGWPCYSVQPATKATIGEWVQTIHDQEVRLSSHVTREGAADHGDVIVVYYHTPMLREYPDGRKTGADSLWRITHT